MRCFSYIYSPLVMGLVEKPYRSVMADDSFSLDSLYLHCIGTRCEYTVNWFTAFQHILDIYYVTLRNIVSECYYTRTYMARILYSHFFSLNIILTCYEGNIIGQKNHILRIQYVCGWSSSTSPQRINGTLVILAERKHRNVVCTSIYRYLSVITMRVRAREWESGDYISCARI